MKCFSNFLQCLVEGKGYQVASVLKMSQPIYKRGFAKMVILIYEYSLAQESFSKTWKGIERYGNLEMSMALRL